MVRFRRARVYSVRYLPLLLCAILAASSAFGMGCGKNAETESQATTSQQQDQFLAALEKMSPESRPQYVAQHSKEMQSIMNGGDATRHNRLMALMQQR